MMRLDWPELWERAEQLDLDGRKVWGIPRGGTIVAGMLARLGAIPVPSHEAEIAVDDLIDSGETARAVKERYGLETVALFDKPREGLLGTWLHFPWEEEPERDIADSVRRMVEYVGDDVQRQGLIETPERVVRSWKELYGGYEENPNKHLKWFEDDTDEMIISTGLNVYSMCEHHMLPFFGKAAIGYIPQGRVLGASKLARITDVFARRLQIQERLTRQIGEVLESEVLGVAVSITAQHLCMVSRGVNQQDSHLTTNYLTGPFRDIPQARAEFFAAVRG